MRKSLPEPGRGRDNTANFRRRFLNIGDIPKAPIPRAQSLLLILNAVKRNLGLAKNIRTRKELRKIIEQMPCSAIHDHSAMLTTGP
jgi:hypothetical protein